MTPPRSRDRLDFIKTLPCCVCGRSRNVQPCHTPRLAGDEARGMGQKRDDFRAIPMCWIHHAEQHSIGWPRFIQTYDLDLQEILRELREKPVLVVWSGIPTLGQLCPRDPRFFGWGPRFVALYRDQEFILKSVDDGLEASLDLAFRVCGEYLRDQLRERHLKKAS